MNPEENTTDDLRDNDNATNFLCSAWRGHDPLQYRLVLTMYGPYFPGLLGLFSYTSCIESLAIAEPHNHETGLKLKPDRSMASEGYPVLVHPKAKQGQ